MKLRYFPFTTEHCHLTICHKPMIQLLKCSPFVWVCYLTTHVPGQSVLAVAGNAVACSHHQSTASTPDDWHSTRTEPRSSGRQKPQWCWLPVCLTAVSLYACSSAYNWRSIMCTSTVDLSKLLGLISYHQCSYVPVCVRRVLVLPKTVLEFGVAYVHAEL